MGATDAEPTSIRTAALVFCVVLFATVLSASRAPFWGDARLSLTAAASWITTGAPTIDDVQRNDVAVSFDGHRYSKYGLLLTLQCVPAALAMARPLSRTGAGLVVAFVPALFGAVAALFVFLILRRRVAARPAMLLTFCLYFGSPLWIYARTYYGEAQQSCLMAALVWVWLRAQGASVSARRVLVVGLLVGTAVLSKPTFGLLLPFVGVGLLFCDRDRAWRARAIGWLAAGLAPGVLAFLWYNHLRYGAWFAMGYGGERDGTLGFSVPLWSGLYSLMFSSGKSVFLYAPLTLVSIFCARAMWQRARALTLAIMAPTGVWLLVAAAWWAWSGDWGWGPRLLVPIIPLFGMLAVAELGEGGRPKLVWTAGIVGVLVNTLGVLVHYAAYLALLAPFRKLLHTAGSAASMRDDLLFPHYVPELSPIIGHAWMLRSYFSASSLAESLPWRSHALNDFIPPTAATEQLDLAFASSAGGAVIVMLIIIAIVAAAYALTARRRSPPPSV